MWENQSLGAGEMKNLVWDIKFEIMVIYPHENTKKEFSGKLSDRNIHKKVLNLEKAFKFKRIDEISYRGSTVHMEELTLDRCTHCVSMVTGRLAIYGHRCSLLNGWDNGRSREFFTNALVSSMK